MSDLIEYAPVDRGGEIVRQHYQSPEVGVTIPFIQALVTGGFTGLAAFVLALLLELPEAWAWGLGAWAIVQALTWVYLLNGWRSLIYRMEAALGLDLDGDQFVGDPEPPPTKKVRIELVQDGGAHVQIADLDVEPHKLADLSRGLLAGASFSEAQWSGSGAPFSRRKFRQLRDEFLKRSWVTWVNPESRNQGLELTRAGKAVVSYFSTVAGDPPTLRERNE